MNKTISLCWYCKRTTDETLPCPWIDDGEPVPGWTVTDTHKISGSKIRKGPAMSCTVTECPLFVRSQDNIIFTEYLNKISDEIGFPYSKAHSHPDKLIKKYTEVTGKKHPLWVIHELVRTLKEKEEKKSNKLLDK